MCDVSCSEKRVCDMFHVQRRGRLICFGPEERVCDMFRVQRRWCVICFVFRGEGV